MIQKRLLIEAVLAVHDRLMIAYGGTPGVRDIGLVERALSRPGQTEPLDEDGAFDIAAAYGCGIVRNQCFYDGNKLTAYVAMRLFLELNGRTLTAAEPERVAAMVAVASGDWTETDLAEWLMDNSAPKYQV